MYQSAHALPQTTSVTRVQARTTREGIGHGTAILPGPVVIICVLGLLLFLFVFIHPGTYTVALTVLPSSEQVGGWAGSAQTAPQTKTSAHVTGSVNASIRLLRIDQADVRQYSSPAEHETWSASTCSAASITEVIDAYGHSYRIADILAVEAGIGVITPSQGLLTPAGIDQTAARFGFDTKTLKSPTLDQVLSIANSGKPVIVNFPPSTWAGGHFLVVRGSVSLHGVQYIHLADSSSLDMQYMKRGTFLTYWRGFAKVLTPDPYVVIGKPTISADVINRVLAAYHSPAAGEGQALYDLGIKYGIDPAFALAFFLHESTFGTRGEARTTLSLGNLRCIPDHPCIDQDRGGYASFASWQDGFAAWYELIRTLYVGKWGLTTIDEIIPRYAPSADHNDEADYIAAVKHAIDTWRAGAIIVN